MLEIVMIVSIILSVLYLGTWMAEQGNEDNAHSLWINSGRSECYQEYEKIKNSRRISGYIGLSLSMIAIVCYFIKYFLGY